MMSQERSRSRTSKSMRRRSDDGPSGVMTHNNRLNFGESIERTDHVVEDEQTVQLINQFGTGNLQQQRSVQDLQSSSLDSTKFNALQSTG